MKSCTRCGESKQLNEYSPNADCVGGYATQCKACAAEYQRQRRIANPERIRFMERNRASAKSEKRRAANRQWYADNREYRLSQERQRYVEQGESIRAAAKEYRIANRSKVYEWNGTRRARIRNAMPAWADRAAIASIYAEAALRQASTGIAHHVDHFYPLAGATVSGLHVAANLQILTAHDNLSKGVSCP